MNYCQLLAERPVDDRKGWVRDRETEKVTHCPTDRRNHEETHRRCDTHTLLLLTHFLTSSPLPSLYLSINTYTYPDQTSLRITTPADCEHTGLLQSALLATSPLPQGAFTTQVASRWGDKHLSQMKGGVGGMDQLPSLCSSPAPLLFTAITEQKKDW